MPQRKTHDVYAGNQKVGEVWEHYDNKSSLEAEMNVRISAAKMVLRESLAQDAIDNNQKLKKKQERMKRNYKFRDVLGIVFYVIAIIIAVVFFMMMFANPATIFDKIPMIYFYFIPSLVFAFGGGLRASMPEVNTKRKKPQIDWGGVFTLFFGYGAGFLIAYFLITMFIRNFFLI